MNGGHKQGPSWGRSKDVDQERVEAWGGELGVQQGRLRRYVARSEPRQRTITHLGGLVSEVKRKHGWQLAEQAVERTPDGMQRLLSSAVWSAEAVRDELEAYEVENFGEAEAGLVAEETGVLNQGQHSAGYKRQ